MEAGAGKETQAKEPGLNSEEILSQESVIVYQ